MRFKYKELGLKKVVWTEVVWSQGQKKQVKRELEINDVLCVAVAKDSEGNEGEGPEVTIEMAVREGWWTKSGSKWPTMTKLMLSYRSAKFFGNLYAPDVLMGMHSADEVADISIDVNPEKQTSTESDFINAEIIEEETPPTNPEEAI